MPLQGDKVEGMKYLLAQVARGRDVSEFYADVVRNVIVRALPEPALRRRSTHTLVRPPRRSRPWS